ncbi:sulfatase family protein [Tautonia rosea]|uniref:sulfatase family protein n=1 Tax=Tautonia rosea TaxID=2728037 RepID=UPI0014727FFF|nr:sulfatase [Tautonia rosea]
MRWGWWSRTCCVVTLGVVVGFAGRGTLRAAEDRPPNLIVVSVDNLGYGDIGPFGSELHRTPHLDQMASEGMRLTHFYVTSGVCTPSRASLMTGCYPRRLSMHEDHEGGRVLRPRSATGLHPDEVTIAEVLREAGYATGIFGKWHLGDQPEFLPTRQGFDTFFGIPYSDDMVHTLPVAKERGWPPLPLLRDEEVIEAPVDRNTLVKRCTEEAIAFIEQHRDRPFFVYMPHTMPGSTAAPFASEAFRGRSANGPYGDSVEELDWSLGQVIETLRELGLDEQSLVIWTSDNGAPRRDPPQGSNAPMAGWGYSTAEGGMRVPCLARWPGKIPAGSTCEELVSTLDFLPTFAALAGVEPPKDRHLDGFDVRELLFGTPGARSPTVAFFYYEGPHLQAVRSGPWKLYLPLGEGIRPPHPAIEPGRPALFDVSIDPGESIDCAADQPQVVRLLLALADEARTDLGDGDRPGVNQRPTGRVDSPKPLTRDQGDRSAPSSSTLED